MTQKRIPFIPDGSVASLEISERATMAAINARATEIVQARNRAERRKVEQLQAEQAYTYERLRRIRFDLEAARILEQVERTQPPRRRAR